MTTIHHILCGSLHAPPNPRVICHCLLLEDRNGLALVDTGIGLLDGQNPEERIGRAVIDMAGFQFFADETAVRQIERLGFRPEEVQHAILTHGDADHVGGLADMPHLQVHLSAEEHASIITGHARYLPIQFAHGPYWHTYPASEGEAIRTWYGLEARPVALGFASDVLLIPLFGHTLGHCGVAIQQGEKWVLHAGDAYYLGIELETDDHPVSQVAAARADDDARRRVSLQHLRRLVQDYPQEITLFGYHDPSEFKG